MHAAGPRSRSAIVRVKVPDLPPRTSASIPASCSLPIPQGMCPPGAGVIVETEAERLLTAQIKPLDRWPDGSVRWALIDLLMDEGVSAGESLTISIADEDEASDRQRSDGAQSSPPVLRIEEDARGILIDTGAARFRCAPGAAFPFLEVTAGGGAQLDPKLTHLEAIDGGGKKWRAKFHECRVEHAGSVRTTVRWIGAMRSGKRRPLLDVIARIHFYAGRSSVRMQLTVRNSRRADHRGGHWELGDSGSIMIRDLSLHLAHPGFTDIAWIAEPDRPVAGRSSGPLELDQDSSGGEHWQSRVHMNRNRKIPMALRGYRERLGKEERTGLRAEPWVSIRDNIGGIAIRPRWFWQNFPKSIDAGQGTLIFRLFPKRFASLHEIQGGEQKTHELCISFGNEAIHPELGLPAEPLRIFPSPQWLESSGAIPYLIPRAGGPPSPDGRESPAAEHLHDRLVDSAIQGPHSFEMKREAVDEYGWRHFGEIWADHESKFHERRGEFISHYNNQYDPVYGAFLQFARTGDARWFRMMEELARHVIDIDVYHTTEDKAAYNHGLFWHTVHYVDADLATHRSYPKRGSAGGGPDDEHNYTTGLMHLHFLTGDPLARETVLTSAQWVIDADDGALTVLRWIDRGRTGLATKTREFGYHGPGRGAGNSLNALLDAWRLTGDERFLEKAREIIRRVVHPHENIDEHRLLDAENRWSYTVFLQALGKYLDVMAAAGRLDPDYAYARESLLAYARWMASHERPTLDRPQDVEHPTETWAAQDIRKADVFLFAALHTSGEERSRFVERAQFFFRHSLETLDTFPTKTYARPVILLMHYGMMSHWWEKHPEETRPPGPPAGDIARPLSFIPQKMRAIPRLRMIAAAGAALSLAIAAGLILRWVLP